MWQARVWRARVAVRVGCREMRWGGVIVGTRLWVARWDDMVRRQTSGASWCTVTISVAPSATTAAWTTSARAHRRKTQEMQTTAKAHNKPLRSEDSERDARVALVGSAVKVVSAHGHRVRRSMRPPQPCSHVHQMCHRARERERASWGGFGRARCDGASRGPWSCSNCGLNHAVREARDDPPGPTTRAEARSMRVACLTLGL